MEKYAIGLDFGTLSGRAVLVRVSDGAQLSMASMDYPHAVMDNQLPCGKRLPVDFALQHPGDYLRVLEFIVPRAVAESGVDPRDIIGLGVDFTGSTTLPVLPDGTPLCFLPEYEENPYAYVLLWKHHAAQKYAEKMTRAAREQGLDWLSCYGGMVSSEWALPKLWQVMEEAPEIYDRMAHWMEAGDWLIWQMTGRAARSACFAGYKAFHQKRTGDPSPDFLASLHPKMRNALQEKLSPPLAPLGPAAGYLTAEMAERLHLRPGIPVSAAVLDAHVCMPAVGIDQPGEMLLILGTSAVHLVMGREMHQVPGMCGVVEDGILPGLLCYEAGQSCMGDHFAWLVKNCCPADYFEAAREKGLSIQEYLTELAARLSPGESGLMALDWWNGNRSVLVDYDLEGMLLGMTLQTTCQEIYRALIEATAYGTRIIIENFRENGVPVNSICASGGISRKNPLLMQIYADVLDLPIQLAGSAQGPALGAAAFGAVAAGSAAGGYDSLAQAARHMGRVDERVYTPIPKNVAVYDRLFREYKTLHDYFGRGGNDVMKRLKAIKKQAR